MKVPKLTLLAVIAALIAFFFIFDLQQYLTLDALKAQREALESYRSAHPGRAIAVFATVYIAVTALSLPGATVLTLAGGALFGMYWGTLIVSFASSIGATLAFLAARFLFRDTIKSRFGPHLKVIDEGFEREGAFYLFSLRLVPIFPFFIINLATGVTSFSVWTFYCISQIGMLPVTLLYVNAGIQLAKIQSLSGILSPALLASFVLLGLFPLLAKKIVDSVNRRSA